MNIRFYWRGGGTGLRAAIYRLRIARGINTDLFADHYRLRSICGDFRHIGAQASRQAPKHIPPGLDRTDVKYFVLGCFAGQFSGRRQFGYHCFRPRQGGHALSADGIPSTGLAGSFSRSCCYSIFWDTSFHRAMHKIPWLWRFHCIHHSSKEMDWLVNVRVHPVDKISSDCVQIIPTLCLGFSPLPLLAFTIFMGVQGFFEPFSIFGEIMVCCAGCWSVRNSITGITATIRIFTAGTSAPHLVIFDWLFGTAWLPPPTTMPASYGMMDKLPEGFVDQLVQPFRSGPP